MSDTSARLELPFILPAQAQKHVTHNEALLRLDALVQLVLQDVAVDTPPASPSDGQLWAIGAAPTGDWTGHAGEIAQWVAPGWAFFAPQTGWRAWDAAASGLKVFDGAAWVTAGGNQNQPGLGIQTSWDSVNRLAVASEASLFNNAGQGHQLKINKASAGDTASLLYQSNFTGHAEMGLAGNTDFAIKVSDDGSSWTDAMIFDGAAGTVSGAAVQSSATDIGAGKLARADYAYGPGNFVGTVSESGGTITGAAMESGSNANGKYIRFADGTQICWRHFGSGANTHTWTYPAAFIGNTGSNLALSATAYGGSSINVTVNWSPSATQAQFRLFNAGGAAISSQIHVQAMGRWY